MASKSQSSSRNSSCSGCRTNGFGHVAVDPRGPKCLCGSRGCLEAYTSNLATLSRYLGHPFSPTETRKMLQESRLTIDDVIARARSGERRAQNALRETARYLGGGLAVIINTLNPAQIFVGGEITEAWDQIVPVMTSVIREHALTSLAAETPLVPEPASSYPRLRGATALVAAPIFAAPQVA